MREPWRYRCPNGHTAWEPRATGRGFNGGGDGADYYCKTCQEHGDDPHFDSLVDMKQGGVAGD